MPIDLLKRNLLDPPREYGPTPFFALNSDLKPEDLEWALEEMAKAGMAGVFLHPRTGLEIEYLSEEFFGKIGLAIETCAKLGLKAWLYDEYNWPSGVAGGKLLSAHPEYRQKYLDWLMVKKPSKGRYLELPGEAVSVFSVGEGVELLENISAGNQVRIPRLTTPVLIFYQAECRDRMFVNSCANWVNPEPGYLDLMNPGATKAFIEMTYDQYAKRFSEHFGRTIPGIFTDEPQNYNGFPWSADFARRFEKEYGYDPIPHLYLLTLDRGNYIKFRVQFYGLAERLMREGFYSQLSGWCVAHNLIFTGHLGMEERISQLAVNHGGIADHLSAMEMPGMDALNVGDGLNGGLSNMEAPNFSAKAVSSIAHLSGRKRVLCETGGGAGWQMPLWRFKQTVDWLFGMGINFINPHQSLLSIKGLRKRDFPPSHFWQEPWWEYYPEFSRYVACVSWLLSQGEHQPELAVLIPRSEFQALSRGRGFQDEELFRLSDQIENLCRDLLEAQRDFEFIFEETIGEGKVRADQGKIFAGAEGFELLMVPSIKVISKAAMELIENLVRSGGKAIFLGPLPLFDQGGAETGEWRDRILGFKDQVKIFAEPENAVIPAIEALARVLPPVLSLNTTEPLKVIAQKRKIGEDEAFFLANLQMARFRVRGFLRTDKKGVEIFCPSSGGFNKLPFTRERNGISFQIDLEPLESLILIASDRIDPPWVSETDLVITEFDDQKISGFYPEDKPRLKTGDQELKLESKLSPLPPIPIPGPFSFQPLGPNLFRLGPFSVLTKRAGSRPWSEMKQEFFFSGRTRALIYFLKPLLGLLNVFLRSESRYRGLIYSGFGELEQEMDRVSRLLGMPLRERGLYQAIDLLFRFADYLPLRTEFKVYPPAGAYYEARANFRLESVPAKLELVWEDLGKPVEILINGRRVELDPKPVLVWDRANLAMEIGQYVKLGKNHLSFRSEMPDFASLYPSFHSIEPLVLRGEFELGKRQILKSRETIKPAGDLRELGYPHYSGKFKYQADLEIPGEYLDFYLLLDCGEVREQVEVLVNGKSAGRRFGPPYQFPIRDLVEAGKNRIEWIVSNTAANLLSAPEPSGLFGPVMILPFYRFSKSRNEL